MNTITELKKERNAALMDAFRAPETIKGIIYREMRKRCRRGLR